MAIVLDATTDGGFSATSSLTFSHTCTGSNLILFVSVLGLESTDLVTGVTYAGVSMTRIEAASNDANDGEWLTLYMLVGPATGANNVIVTKSSAGGGEVAGAVSYTGASQTGQPDAHTNGKGGTATSITGTLTTIADNCWLVMATRTAQTQTAGANTTARATMGGSSTVNLWDSNADQTPAGSHSLNTSFSSSVFYKYVIASFSPTAITTTSTSTTTTSTSTSTSSTTTTTSTSTSSSTSTTTTSTSTSTSSSTSSTSTSTTQTGTTTSTSTTTTSTSTSTTTTTTSTSTSSSTTISTTTSTSTTTTSTSTSTTTTSTSTTTTVPYLKFTVQADEVLQLDVNLVK